MFKNIEQMFYILDIILQFWSLLSAHKIITLAPCFTFEVKHTQLSMCNNFCLQQKIQFRCTTLKKTTRGKIKTSYNFFGCFNVPQTLGSINMLYAED